MTIAVCWLYSKIGYDPENDTGGWLFFALIGDTTVLSVLAVCIFA